MYSLVLAMCFLVPTPDGAEYPHSECIERTLPEVKDVAACQRLRLHWIADLENYQDDTGARIVYFASSCEVAI